MTSQCCCADCYDVSLMSVDAGAPPGGITVAGLRQVLCDSSVSVLLMDVRSREDFSASHVKTADCINVPADCLQPGFVRRSLGISAEITE